MAALRPAVREDAQKDEHRSIGVADTNAMYVFLAGVSLVIIVFATLAAQIPLVSAEDAALFSVNNLADIVEVKLFAHGTHGQVFKVNLLPNTSSFHK